ncbi:DEAD/DEAH box helicase [Mycoplasma buteonis]|uniref:DEAD/DEAH box helicase n=1 Tax=Mycoplasma buteonis TaxID=171280 RepID=UPI0005621BF3|nr:DEAD/DEAH box helicase family protein [Mycoplasma buteonis]
MIKLKQFQKEAIDFLLRETNNNVVETIILKSCTGSGKTIIAQSYIQELISLTQKQNYVFLWLTPGKGELEMQSKLKMEKHFNQLDTGLLNDVLTQGFRENYTYFVNWELITNKKNKSITESERKNWYDRVYEAHQNHLKFIVIVDEEHSYKTAKTSEILEKLHPYKEIRISATTSVKKASKNIVFYQIDDKQVIDEGLIAKKILMNKDIETKLINDKDIYLKEAEILIDLAIDKQKQMYLEFQKEGLNVNPLVLIQIPNMNQELLNFVLELLNKKDFNYDNGTVARWTSDDKINADEGLVKNNSPITFLIFKQAIATGWDCPRAKILVKLRTNMTEQFEIQTVGRIRRTINQKHYDNDVIDNCYIYTFDEKLRSEMLQIAAEPVVEKIVNLKSEFESFALTKQVRNHEYEKIMFNQKHYKEVKNAFKDFLKSKYNLTNNYAKNREILENKGFTFNERVLNDLMSGDIYTSDGSISDLVYIPVEYTFSNATNNGDYLNAIRYIGSRFEFDDKNIQELLEHIFFYRPKISNNAIIKLGNLNFRNFKVFIMNNYKLIGLDAEEFRRSTQYVVKQKIKVAKPFSNQSWKILKNDLIVFNHKNYNENNFVEKSVYEKFPRMAADWDLRKSKSERRFEEFCINSDFVKYFYKNHDKGVNYFSIGYLDTLGKNHLFYPDYILIDKNNKIWIIETKGGETQEGINKQIDKDVSLKFNALKKYAAEFNLNFGFVRDKEISNSLLFNNTEYEENLNSNNWIDIKKIFD